MGARSISAGRRIRCLVAAVVLLTALLAIAMPASLAIPPSLDGDGDGWVNAIETLLGSDAGDPFKTPESFAIPPSCMDGADNDGDGATDDADPGCHPIPVIDGTFPPAGFDVFESDLTLSGLTLDTQQGACPVDFEGFGPTVVRRGNPAPAAGGEREIDVEIVAMQLTGTGELLPGSPCNPGQQATSIPMTVVEDPAKASAGKVTALDAGADFPAESFFDVFFLVDTPSELVPGSLQVTNDLVNTLPPYHTPNDPAGNPGCYDFGGVHEHCPKPPLDHFKCYTGDFPAFTPEDVSLVADQFLGSPATVSDPELFCNPVQKNRLPIFDQGAHLEFFGLDSPDSGAVNGEPVVVRNQFGTQTFVLGDLVSIGVPTRKDPHPPPLALDHYTCYEVTGNQLNRPVSLVDQFHTHNTVVSTPLRLCNPAYKVHDGLLTTAADLRWHLVCYAIQPTALSPVTVAASNQFASATIVARQPSVLCTPSQKFFEKPPAVIPPLAFDDGPFEVAEGGTLTVPDGPSDLLGNDIDVDGDPLTATKAADPAHGVATVDADGGFTYVHDGSETATDSFTYRAGDGTAESEPATVSIVVSPVNDPPVAVDDGPFTVAEGGTLTVDGVLDNDTDAEGDPLTAAKVSDPAHGDVTLGADGSFTYAHDGSDTTSDSFTYEASDGSADSNVATVQIAVTPVGPTVGLVDPTQGRWYLRNGAGPVPPFFYGNPNDVPFMGDWDCDGDDTPGLFRQSDAFAYLRNTNSGGIADIRFFFGDPSDVPLAGDWDGDGCDTVSIYRPDEQRFYIINELGENEGGLGAADFAFVFGDPGDKPVVGDWDDDGIDEVGLHRESTGFFYWRDTLDTGVASGQIFFGDPNDRFVAGDWGVVDGADTPAVFRPSTATFFFRHTLTQGVADDSLNFGEAPWLPVAGEFGLG